MLHKLEWCDDESPDGTGYNDKPIGFREISPKEFAKTRFHYRYVMYQEFRQILIDKMYENVMMFWFEDKTGIAFISDLKDKVRYFAFGCDHKYREVPYDECRDRDIFHLGSCWHVSECTKCGHMKSEDSSD